MKHIKKYNMYIVYMLINLIIYKVDGKNVPNLFDIFMMQRKRNLTIFNF